ncbi:hypothetical protein A3I18_01340 [Candidatus Campbellbacteria bacterium RIFCSPLOWO2_02_FULL_35_11]|uniref:Inner membrane protein YgaP-like transmembrane domain-containing protein n=2 Tax=Candidatus Campbelliibacteriota TaxID=1752727 RepID=A0A1F5ENB6_9BACT|nr:MAG: hypothetical protein A3E89_01835 [Candidatus Campbellbacteria bacterium RIFCSPHIGHO2_12_FULL_35_10]OGD70303.1 MAG: hypothetical protein A3I18_01340 [Candidatus Campbellbacteria bacterium RIFCSPLOWO2_02_FULL_35_11]
MRVENAIKMTAGLFVFFSALAGFFISKYWLLFTMFVGINLFQYSITGFCFLETFFKKMGMKE